MQRGRQGRIGGPNLEGAEVAPGGAVHGLRRAPAAAAAEEEEEEQRPAARGGARVQQLGTERKRPGSSASHAGPLDPWA